MKTWQPKTAMVLAAGLGERMRPLSSATPKPLIKFRGKTLIDHVLDRLAGAGIETAIINVHYLADQVEAHLASRKGKPEIVVSDERTTLLDTGGGIARALPLIGDNPFLIHNSDSTWIDGVGSNLKRLFAAWDPHRMDGLMLLALSALSLGYEGRGDFTMAPDGLLARRAESREAPFVFTGVSIAHPRLFDEAPAGPFSMNVLWDRAIRIERLFGFRLDGRWMHLGTPDTLQAAERWLDGEVAL